MINQSSTPPKQVMVVCLGNICRSPLAAAILQNEIDHANLPITVKSAGTAAYHIGKKADQRSIRCAEEHELDLNAHRAQQLSLAHLQDTDLILVMDDSNFKDVKQLMKKHQATVPLHFFTAKDTHHPNKTVADPYYFEYKDFVQTYHQCLQAAHGWTTYWKQLRNVNS